MIHDYRVLFDIRKKKVQKCNVNQDNKAFSYLIAKKRRLTLFDGLTVMNNPKIAINCNFLGRLSEKVEMKVRPFIHGI